MKCMISCPFQLIHSPPKMGALLTVKYADYFKNGSLRHSYFWRVNEDQQEGAQMEEFEYFFNHKWHSCTQIIV